MRVDLSGRIALVTGSARGIGFAVARELREAGARVIVHGRSQESARRAAVALSGTRGPGVLSVAGELDAQAGVESVAHGVLSLTQGAGVDLLVHNAGMYERAALADSTPQQWLRAYQVNTVAAQELTRLLSPLMVRRGGGSIVWVASESGVQVPDRLLPHYGASKAAMVMAAKCWADHLTGTGVSSVALLPGPTLTEGNRQAAQDLADAGKVESYEAGLAAIVEARPASMLGRWAEPSEVAQWVVFLASPAGQLATGSAVNVSSSIRALIP